MKILKGVMTFVAILFFLAALGILPATAQLRLPACEELGTHPDHGLEGNPQIVICETLNPITGD